MRVAIISSGFSEEKGVSINSSKSIYEILENNPYVETIKIIFIDDEGAFFLLNKNFLFVNTVEDFVHSYKKNHPIYDIVEYLKLFDKVFLTTHGAFGEDGQLQEILEANHIDYIGPSAQTAKDTFFKLNTLKKLWSENICKEWFCQLYKNEDQVKDLIKNRKKICIKPNDGGSSIGVAICEDFKQALDHIKYLKSKKYEPILEEVHEGVEFSINVINGVSFDPTEIITEGIFTYENKYFPSEKVVYKNPPSFSKKILNKIKKDGVKIYKIFNVKNFLRIDGFYNKKNNNIIYTDLNSIPGFQLNGLFFKNKNHFNIMNQLIIGPIKKEERKRKKELVYLIFGGDSSEKNVSIVSGANVIFNLTKEKNYEVKNYLLFKKKLWELKYEECFQTSMSDFQNILKRKKPIDFTSFFNLVKETKGVVFNGLHGGIGENGVLQSMLEENQILYTGSDSKTSSICMNKRETIKRIKEELEEDKNLYFLEESFFKNFKNYKEEKIKKIWKNNSIKFIKPNDDGCSVGGKIINNYNELISYQRAVRDKKMYFENLPMSLTSKDYILQEYIETDIILSKKNKVEIFEKKGWLEGTVGTIGKKVLEPSLCISSSGFLTMEEKFLQGVGTNLTPIPSRILKKVDINIIKKTIKKIIDLLNINTYCRVDFFYNSKLKKLIIIEVNTLPALTPATVLLQQAIYINLSPRLLFKKILKLAKIPKTL